MFVTKLITDLGHSNRRDGCGGIELDIRATGSLSLYAKEYPDAPD